VNDASPVLLCEVFRSPRRPGTYLYVARSEGLSRVPEPLLAHFGTPESVLTLKLHAERRLAQADAVEVLRALDEQGFYLQLPPPEQPQDRNKDAADAD
jgi:hypothetical protein